MQCFVNNTVVDNKSTKRWFNTNDSFDRKRFRDSDEMSFQTNLNQYYTNGSNDTIADNDGWLSDYELKLMSITNDLSRFRVDFVDNTEQWPEYTPNKSTDDNKKKIPKKSIGFPPKLSQIFFGYKLDQLISCGKRSAVYRCHKVDKIHKLGDKELIIKFGIEFGCNLLLNEYKTYTKLTGLLSVPALYDQINWRKYSEDYSSIRWCLIVIEKFGLNLIDFMKKSNNGVIESEELVFEIAVQLIDCIESIHEKGFIYCGLKPENILIENESKLSLKCIGFSHSKSYLTKNWEHIEEEMERNFRRQTIETDLSFMSINYHNGCPVSRRDDMESLGYCLVYIKKGSLPWVDPNDNSYSTSSIRRLAQRMRETSIENLCTGMSDSFSKYFDLISHYNFKDKPNYEELRQLFRFE